MPKRRAVVSALAGRDGGAMAHVQVMPLMTGAMMLRDDRVFMVTIRQRRRTGSDIG
jgi:hypothetical protein